MDLSPCAACRRHVDSRATSCPFCATPITRVVKRLFDVGGRLSRAAVFAGAAACYTNPAPAQHITAPPPPPPPPSDAAVVQTQEQQFAQPPDDAAVATANGAIEGTLYAANKAVMAGDWLVLRRPDGGVVRVQTDAKGHYRFADLPPGNYSIETPWNGNPHSRPPQRAVQVISGQTMVIDLTVYMPAPDRGPCCKPYGAPPARRRVV